MIFKNLLFLYLLPLALIPLLLHLFFIKFLKIQPFPWLGFISEKEDERRKRKRVKEILILISRILFLFFLLIFLSSPFFKRNVFPDFIVLDSSESTLLYRNEFRNVEKKFLHIFGKQSLLKEKKLITEGKQGIIFVISDGDENFFENAKMSTSRFFIFLPETKKQDIGIWKAELKEGSIDVDIYSSKEVPDAILKVISEGTPFSYNVKLNKGINSLNIPLKVENFRFLKLQVLPYDSLPENNLYSISKPFIKKYYKPFGDFSKYLEKLLTNMGYKKAPEETGDSLIYIFYGIPEDEENLKVLNELISTGKPCIVFVDRENKFLETSIKQNVNIKMKDEIVYFSKIFDIKAGKPIFREQGITYASSYKNTLIFGFLPEPDYTDIIYSPSFLYLLKKGIANLKVKIPQVISAYRDTFIYFDSEEYRIYDFEGNFLKKGYADRGKINLDDLPYGSYIIKNSENLYIDINFSKKEIIMNKISEDDIKNILPNAEVYKWDDLHRFMPISIKGLSLTLSILFILMEILFIILL